MSKDKRPIKGDKVYLSKEVGTVLDDDFDKIEWENGDIEEWSGMWGTFIDMGGYIIKNEKE